MAIEHDSDLVHGLAAPVRLVQILALAAAFLVVSLTGLYLVPAGGQDVVILRGTGFGLAALVFFGRGLWPGVFLGALASRILIAYLGIQTMAPGPAMVQGGLLVLATTAQCVATAGIIRQICGFPLRLTGFRQLALIGGVILPVSCLYVPTIGMAIFVIGHPAGSSNLVHNWIIWWVGDLIGVALTLPMAVLGPWNSKPALYWRDIALPRFSPSAVVYIAFSVAVTFLSWYAISRMGDLSDEAQFRTLVGDNARALQHRFDAYDLGLRGGAGFYRSSTHVSEEEWTNYVRALNLGQNLKGLNGIGFAEIVAPQDLAKFQQEMRDEGVGDVTIKPAMTADPMFVVKYFAPAVLANQVLGLNIAYEENRAMAAITARDTGNVTITRPIVIWPETERRTGFLLLAPVYSTPDAPTTVQGRRDAFLGWVYAPVFATRMLDDLTRSQTNDLTVSIYSGPDIDKEKLLYTDVDVASVARLPRFRIVDRMEIFGQTWTFEWQSSPVFESRLSNIQALAILVVGLLFSFLFGIFLLNLTRREELIRDIVALRTGELAAQVEENRSIIESAVAKIALLDGQGNVMRVNDALIRVLGRERNQLIGKPFSLLVDGQLDSYFDRPEGASDHPSYRGVLRTTSGFGQAITLDVQIIPWVTGAGEWRYTAVMRNITEQRRIQDQLRSTQHRLDLALTGAKIGVFDIDLRTGKSIVSRTWRDLLGYRDDEEVDSQQSWRKRVHPDDLPKVNAADEACIEGRVLRSVTEYRVQMQDGSWRWMRSDAVGEDRDADGRAWRLIGLQTDVTDQRQVEELKTQFVSTVSHELRTPLTSINGSVSLLLNAMSEGIPEAARRMLSIAQKNCDRLILLVNDILDLEKLEAGPPKPLLAAADLSVQVLRAIQVNQPFASRFNVTYETATTVPGVTVMIEENRFQQIMTNLLSNAAKFSPRGGVVTVSVETFDAYAKVSVTDHGRGIPAEFHDRIFKAFSQVDGSSNRQSEGTGLGLHIAKKTIEQMDGQIGFVSEPGVVTTFWVTVMTAVGIRPPREEETPDRPGKAPTSAIPRILHIEADKDFAAVLVAAYRGAAEIVNATDEIAAHAFMKSAAFDLVILDWDLGRISGAELLEEIRLRQPGVPIIALTGFEHHANAADVEMTLIKSRIHLEDVAERSLSLIKATADSPAA